MATHDDWLTLIQRDGLVISEPVLEERFPGGPHSVPRGTHQWFRRQAERYLVSRDHKDEARRSAGVRRWVDFLLEHVLELPRKSWWKAGEIPDKVRVYLDQFEQELRPDRVLHNGKDLVLLVTILEPGQKLDKRDRQPGRWKASPTTKMDRLLRETEVPLGLVSNGEEFRLIYAPKGFSTGHFTWTTRSLVEEKATLDAFYSLLGRDSLLPEKKDDLNLADLCRISQDRQGEVADQLGEQVRNGLERLIWAWDDADRASNGELLQDMTEDEIYEMGLVIMMRLVFLLYAEERHLLPHGEVLYDQGYGLTYLWHRLMRQKREEESRLDTTFDAWDRFLATCRLVHGGCTHQDLNLLAYGGRLFDPERFPALERAECQVSNRTFYNVLWLLLFAKQKKGGEPQRVGYWAIDVEQIGYIYEGLLDHRCARAGDVPMVKLRGAGEAALEITELEALDADELVDFFRKQTKTSRSPESIRDALDAEPDAATLDCLTKFPAPVVERVRPYANLVQCEEVVPPRWRYLTTGTSRRASGAHYTPQSLTERIVRVTLEPLVYRNVEGKPGLLVEPKEVKTPRELLDLKVCDMAMGSGAFLVQAVRYLGDRMVEAWDREVFRSEFLVSSFEFSESGEDDGFEGLSGSGGLAARDGACRGNLRSDEILSEVGDLRSDVTNTEGGGIGPGEHSRGSGTRSPQSISEPLVDIQRFADGSGDLDPNSPSPRLHRQEYNQTSHQPNRRNQTPPQRSKKLPQQTKTKLETKNKKPKTKNSKLLSMPYAEPAKNAQEDQLINPENRKEMNLWARRYVVERCIYGVDVNHLAVEMAKLSLWLTTLSKDKPFTFLDHALRCGDSLVGIDEEQLRTWSIDRKGSGSQILTLESHLNEAVEKAIDLRRRLQLTAVVDAEDLKVKREFLGQADEAMERIRLAGDLIVAPSFAEESSSSSSELRDKLLNQYSESASESDWAALRAEADRHLNGQRTFHWPLEFPEVFLDVDRGGFDAFVGNPPYIGGQFIRRQLGPFMLSYLRERWPWSHGTTDYVAFFFLRAFEGLHMGGTFGLLATNTISQGDTRESGLDYIAAKGGTIFNAVARMAWAGTAAVNASQVHVIRGAWKGPFALDERIVSSISTSLDDLSLQGKPERLAQNRDKSFQGSNVLGLGFTMSPEEAAELIEKDPRNRDVLFPYLNGKDLNTSPDQSPSRWIISFGGRSLKEAGKYPVCLEIVRCKVLPQRAKSSRKDEREKWWQFTRWRPELYRAIAPLERVLVRPEVSRTWAFSFVPNGWVYSHMLIVFPSQDSWFFAVLQSSFHQSWSEINTSSMKADLRYAPTDCFETFPFPQSPTKALEAALERIGETYHEHRRELMLELNEGLTKLYNRFHTPPEQEKNKKQKTKNKKLELLRDLHVEMDNAVRDAYGWDFDLEHGWIKTVTTQEKKDRKTGKVTTVEKVDWRFTISEAARQEVLRRLLELNHEIYEQEVAEGLHDKGKKGKAASKAKGAKRGRKPKDEKSETLDLFGEDS